jgi:hypothetical protein
MRDARHAEDWEGEDTSEVALTARSSASTAPTRPSLGGALDASLCSDNTSGRGPFCGRGEDERAAGASHGLVVYAES